MTDTLKPPGRPRVAGGRLRLETRLLKDTQIQLSKADVRLFRNNVGAGFTGWPLHNRDGSITLPKWNRVIFGFGPGSSDLIGWRTVVIRPEHVGKKVAQFVALEAKSKGGKLSKTQANFIRAVRAAGGRAGVFRNEREAQDILDGKA